MGKTLQNVPDEDAIDRPPQIECNVLLDEFPIVMETRKAVQQLSSGRPPSADAIPADGRETDCCFTVYGGRRLSHKNLRMHP